MKNKPSCHTFCDYLATESGLLKISANDEAITAIAFVEQQDEPYGSTPLLQQAKQQLTDYFEQKRKTFDLPLAPAGTKFQRNVWRELRAIPYGVTCSYADIAKRLNNPNAVRAVGSANGKNPISIIVPCHRVIGTNGTLTGYAGGLQRKAFLLLLENPLFSAREPK